MSHLPAPFAAASIKPCGCGARVAMVPHERTGKPAPVELEPASDGIITLNYAPQHPYEAVSYHVMSDAECALHDATAPLQPARYRSHFQYCPRAAVYRNRPRAQRAQPSQPSRSK